MLQKIFSIALVVACASSILLSAIRCGRQIKEGYWEAAEAVVRSRWRDGDRLVFEPDYVSEPGVRMGDLALLPERRLNQRELDLADRIHLLRVDAAAAPQTTRLRLGQWGQARDPWSRGGLSVETFVRATSQRVVFDLHSAIRDAHVEAYYEHTKPTACARFDRDRFVCPRDPGWNWVGRATMDMGGRTRTCVWMHPIRDGARLSIQLPEAAAAQRGVLRGGLGFTDHGARAARAPVRFRLYADDVLLLEKRRAVEPGWQTFETNFPGASSWRIEVDTRDNGAAHFCANLWLLADPNTEPTVPPDPSRNAP